MTRSLRLRSNISMTTWARMPFTFSAKFRKLQLDYERGLYGGPTIYSLIEAGMKRGIPVNYLKVEHQFQWGYGKKSIRGKSTVLDVDGIKDTEFTEYKDSCKEFLLSCGFPTPRGESCFDEESCVEVANELGFPVVLKPISGHKGQGVTTGIANDQEVREAYQRVLKHHEEHATEFGGVIVEQQVSGRDHRLLAVGGKFVAALEREPAYVIGDGVHDIENLIRIENDTNPDRSSGIRAPLAKIVIDEDIHNYLSLQNLSVKSVPKDGAQIYLRRVANISSGGLSVNVTDIIHPKNIQMVEDIAGFFRVTVLGIDVLTEDISKPWTEGNFGIIEINAGPGIFMHLAPAKGAPIDVPGKLMEHFFPTPSACRVPMIIGNNLSAEFCAKIYQKVKEINPALKYFGSAGKEGAFLNGRFLVKNKQHDANIEIILRHIGLEIAVFSHDREAIHDYGIYHSKADIVILDNPNYAEKMLEREMLPEGYVIDVYEDKIEVLDNEKSLGVHAIRTPEEKEAKLLEIIGLILPEILKKY
jgi:cyanophycin synthetase